MARFFGVTVLSLVVACGVGADVLRLDEILRPQTHPDSVILLGREPDQSYDVIALVAVRSGDRGVGDLRKRLIQEAARVGGQAVLLDSESLRRGEDGRKLTGKVIVFSRAKE